MPPNTTDPHAITQPSDFPWGGYLRNAAIAAALIAFIAFEAGALERVGEMSELWRGVAVVVVLGGVAALGVLPGLVGVSEQVTRFGVVFGVFAWSVVAVASAVLEASDVAPLAALGFLFTMFRRLLVLTRYDAWRALLLLVALVVVAAVVLWATLEAAVLLPVHAVVFSVVVLLFFAAAPAPKGVIREDLLSPVEWLVATRGLRGLAPAAQPRVAPSIDSAPIEWPGPGR